MELISTRQTLLVDNGGEVEVEVEVLLNLSVTF